jgi:hypothetical protein
MLGRAGLRLPLAAPVLHVFDDLIDLLLLALGVSVQGVVATVEFLEADVGRMEVGRCVL